MLGSPGHGCQVCLSELERRRHGPRTGGGTPVCPSEQSVPQHPVPLGPPQDEKTGFPSHPALGSLKTPICMSSTWPHPYPSHGPKVDAVYNYISQ